MYASIDRQECVTFSAHMILESLTLAKMETFCLTINVVMITICLNFNENLKWICWFNSNELGIAMIYRIMIESVGFPFKKHFLISAIT